MTYFVFLLHNDILVVLEQISAHRVEIFAAPVLLDQVQHGLRTLIQCPILYFLPLPSVGIVLHVKSQLRRDARTSFSALCKVLDDAVITALGDQI